MSYVISGCKKDILVLFDYSNFFGLNTNVTDFLKNFIKSEKLRVEEQGTHLGFTTFSKDNRTRELLKVGKITNKTELIQWLENFDFGNDTGGDTTYIYDALKIANNVSQ